MDKDPAATDVPLIRTALVVDDAGVVRRLSFRVLSEAGYRVFEAAGAIELGERPSHRTSGNGAKPLRRLRLVVQDDGEGMAPGTPIGLGLTAMRERVNTIEGTSGIESSPQGGTTVRVDIPLRSQASERAEQPTAMQSH